MSFKPDYGLRLRNDGISREVDQFFYDFRLYSLIVLGRGQYSTGVEMPLVGELHALSFDFNQEQLEQILSKAPPQIAVYLRQELSRDPVTPRTIDFEGEVVFGVRARLGELQRAQRESFVPLVAQEILSGSYLTHTTEIGEHSNMHVIRPVAIDEAVCEKVAVLLSRVSIPSDKEDSALEAFTSDEIGNFYLLLVAICHQTQSLEGLIAGSYRRGWDYLSGKLENVTRSDRKILDPSEWFNLSSDSVRDLFHDDQYGDTLTDPVGRAKLIRNLGQVMQQHGWSSLNDLYSVAEKRIAGSSPNLQDLLAKFRAYNDPVRKKTFFLLGLMANTGTWSYVDEGNLGPPVDYHEVRGHLRLGTVIIHDDSLRKKLLSRQPVTENEDIAIRQAVCDAIMHIAKQPQMPKPMGLHYLFWNVFRNVCLRDSPYRKVCPDDCGLPDRYNQLLNLHQDTCRCPFSTICASVEATNLYCEHVFQTDWY